MNQCRSMLADGALALLAIPVLASTGRAAHTAAGNAGLLDKYFAPVKAHNATAQDVIAKDYLQHDARAGRELARMRAASQRYFEPKSVSWALAYSARIGGTPGDGHKSPPSMDSP